MAQQYVQFQATNPDFDPLLVNLAENVKHRRNMEMMKAQQAESLQQDMATGLAPKADFSITDEGLEIKAMDVDGVTKTGRDASNAFYKAMGNMFGNNDMTQEAKSETSTEIVDDGSNLLQQAEEAANRQRATLQDAIDHNNFLRGKQKNIADNSLSTGGPGVYGTASNLGINFDAASKAFDKAIQGAKELRITNPVPMPGIGPGTATPVPMPGVGPGTATPVPMPGVVPPGAPTPSRTSERTNAGASIGTSQSHAGSITVADKTPGLRVSTPVTAITSTTTQGARIDEIKTSLTNLAGLASFRKTFGGDADNVYSKLYANRAADLARWEETAKNTATDVKSVGTSAIDVDPTEASSTVTDKEAMRNITNIYGGTTRVGVTNAGARPADRSLLYTSKNGEKQKVYFDENYNLTKDVTSLQLGGDSYDSLAAQQRLGTVSDLQTFLEGRITTNDETSGRITFRRVAGTKANRELIADVKANNTTYQVTFVNTGTFQKTENGESKSGPRWMVNAPKGLPVKDLEYLLQAVGQ